MAAALSAVPHKAPRRTRATGKAIIAAVSGVVLMAVTTAALRGPLTIRTALGTATRSRSSYHWIFSTAVFRVATIALPQALRVDAVIYLAPQPEFTKQLMETPRLRRHEQ